MVDVAAGREVATFVAGQNPVGMAVSADGLTGFLAVFDEDAVLVGVLPGWVSDPTTLPNGTPRGIAAQKSFSLYLSLILRGVHR